MKGDNLIPDQSQVYVRTGRPVPPEYLALVEELDAACEGVTEGPWLVDGSFVSHHSEDFGVADCSIESEARGRPDAAFIASARSLVPRASEAISALVAEVERLRHPVKVTSASTNTDTFYVEDETPEEIAAAFEHGEPSVTRGPRNPGESLEDAAWRLLGENEELRVMLQEQGIPVSPRRPDDE